MKMTQMCLFYSQLRSTSKKAGFTKLFRGNERRKPSPWAAHLIEEGHGNNTVVGKFDMQTSALVSKDRFKVDYDLCRMGFFNDDEEESPTCFWDFDAELLQDTLSRSRPTVVRLQPEDGGHFVGLCELLQSSHDYWIATWFYGRKFDNRGLALHGDCRGWLIANDAYALVDAQSNALSNIWSGTRSAEKVKEVFNSEGHLCRIQYDQRIGREHWFWNFDEDLRGETMLHHFCVERIKEFRTFEKIGSGGYRIAFVTGNADDHCRSMRECYANQNSL